MSKRLPIAALAITFIGAALLMTALYSPSAFGETAESPRPNIVLIYADDLDADEINCTVDMIDTWATPSGAKRVLGKGMKAGTPKVLTPHIDSLAKDGMLFTFKPEKGGMWGGVPLLNGNYMLQRQKERESVEVDRHGKVVWSVSVDDLRDQLLKHIPEYYSQIGTTQMVERLSNGNTVMFIRGCAWNRPKAIEVTPGKEVVWILQDRGNLGDGFHAHFLDQPGDPEFPEETNH